MFYIMIACLGITLGVIFLAEALKNIQLLKKLPKEDVEQRKELKTRIISVVVMVSLLGGIPLALMIFFSYAINHM